MTIALIYILGDILFEFISYHMIRKKMFSYKNLTLLKKIRFHVIIFLTWPILFSLLILGSIFKF
jgi:hypothetical protein